VVSLSNPAKRLDDAPRADLEARFPASGLLQFGCKPRIHLTIFALGTRTPTSSSIRSKAPTAYEQQQVAEIAAWKSMPVNPAAEAWNMVVPQAANAVTFFIPGSSTRS
jgi:hypothetical protein